MAGLDESVGKLQKFSSDLGRTIAQLGESTASIETHSDTFADLENDAEDRIGGLADDIQEAVRDLGRACDDIEEALGALSDEAEEVAESRLPDARSELDDATSEQRDRVETTGDELQDAFERLSDGGHQEHADAVEDAEAAVGDDDQEDQQAFASLDEGAAEMTGRTEEARSEASASMSEATSGVEEEAGTLETAFADATSQWDQSVDEQLRAGCEDVGAGIEQAYADWTQQARATADELVADVGEALIKAAETVSGESAPQLTEAAAEALNAGAALLDEIAQGVSSLEAGEQLAEALTPLVPNLQTCLRVVEQIDRILNEL